MTIKLHLRHIKIRAIIRIALRKCIPKMYLIWKTYAQLWKKEWLKMCITIVLIILKAEDGKWIDNNTLYCPHRPPPHLE